MHRSWFNIFSLIDYTPTFHFIHIYSIYICHTNIPFILNTLVGVFTAHLRFTSLICNWCTCILNWNQIDIKLDIWIDRNVQKFVSRHNKRTEPGTNNECMILESHNCLTQEIAKIKFFKRFKILLIYWCTFYKWDYIISYNFDVIHITNLTNSVCDLI